MQIEHWNKFWCLSVTITNTQFYCALFLLNKTNNGCSNIKNYSKIVLVNYPKNMAKILSQTSILSLTCILQQKYEIIF